MKWALLGALVWVLLSLPLGLIVGRWFKRHSLPCSECPNPIGCGKAGVCRGR